MAAPVDVRSRSMGSRKCPEHAVEGAVLLVHDDDVLYEVAAGTGVTAAALGGTHSRSLEGAHTHGKRDEEEQSRRNEQRLARKPSVFDHRSIMEEGELSFHRGKDEGTQDIGA